MSVAQEPGPDGVTAPRSHLALYLVVISLFVAGTMVRLAMTGGSDFKVGPDGSRHLSHFFGILVAAGLTLALYTFLYEDNPFFKAAEHIYVGVGLGYQIVVAWFEYIKPEAYKQLLRYYVRDGVPGSPETALLPAMVLSAMLLARFIPALGWLSRIPVAFIVGFTAATQIPNFITANILKQVEQTVVTLAPLAADGSLSIGGVIANVVILIGVIATLFYFFFSVEHKGAFGVGSRIGVWFLMVAFGASFGYTVMGRMALLVGNTRFLLGEWMKVPLQ